MEDSISKKDRVGMGFLFNRLGSVNFMLEVSVVFREWREGMVVLIRKMSYSWVVCYICVVRFFSCLVGYFF